MTCVSSCSRLNDHDVHLAPRNGVHQHRYILNRVALDRLLGTATQHASAASSKAQHATYSRLVCNNNNIFNCTDWQYLPDQGIPAPLQCADSGIPTVMATSITVALCLSIAGVLPLDSRDSKELERFHFIGCVNLSSLPAPYLCQTYHTTPSFAPCLLVCPSGFSGACCPTARCLNSNRGQYLTQRPCARVLRSGSAQPGQNVRTSVVGGNGRGQAQKHDSPVSVRRGYHGHLTNLVHVWPCLARISTLAAGLLFAITRHQERCTVASTKARSRETWYRL